MSISLKEYIESALLEITSGVQDAATKSNIPIAPANVDGKIQRNPQMIEFVIQVTVTEQEHKAGSGKTNLKIPLISVIKADLGGEFGNSTANATAQTIKFSVPVYFQGKKSKN